ncbi:MAG: DegT/DnrJ/EryC1/StrS family aminotransferase, partial [Burkholderiaceae bacterium]
VDILVDSWCLDPAQVEAAITPRTKAIMAVHLYGNLCEMDALRAIGARHGLPVVEDAAEALGSIYRGRRAGSMGAFGSFSFHGTKTMTTGEGGMFVTNDAALFERVLTLANHGRARGQTQQFWPELLGYKYKMSNIQAALGCGQIERIDELETRKRQILSRYRELLAGRMGVSLNPEPAGTVNGAWMPTAVFAPQTGVTRERLQVAFGAENIDARVFFHPLSSLPMFAPRAGGRLAADIPRRAINLPSFHDMSDDDKQRVVGVIRSLLND